ncbi:MAG: cyclic 2,3-diphosphoglycerate synthase [Alphaproteobacteria bacterium]|nr:cyclic 2,3-diphosphoglycerate synthase [Alphaproteobacteria bacterium]
MSEDRPRRVVIMGAAGRDFHNFNVAFRGDPAFEVVAFTAAQIPGIAHRRYPIELAGYLYPGGIPIVDEAELDTLVARERIDEVVFSYSDVEHATVMHVASRALAAGADFRLLGPEATMLRSERPVIAICAVRTGCGKSQTARYLSRMLRERGLKVAVVRHPMPYGNLAEQSLQRFATMSDLAEGKCTAEEREEYEPHIAAGNLVFAGVDYAAILEAAEAEADLIIWDGGNNDFAFFRPDLQIAVTDALRPDQAASHHPGETVARMADIVIVNKVDAPGADAAAAEAAIRSVNGQAKIIRAASPVTLDDAPAIEGKRVLVVEDGPTITHGGMSYGAGLIAAEAAGVGAIVDPRTSAAPAIASVYEAHTHIGPVLPAMGYGEDQLAALRETIEASEADIVIAATPIDLAALIELSKPVIRARYAYADASEPHLWPCIETFLDEKGL